MTIRFIKVAKSLRTKITVSIVFSFLLGFGIAAFLITQWITKGLEEYYEMKSKLTLRTIFDEIEARMATKDIERVPADLDFFRSLKVVRELRIFNLEGKEVFVKEKGPPDPMVEESLRTGSPTHFRKEINKEPAFSYIVPIENKSQCQVCHGRNKELLGVVHISLSMENMIRDIAHQKQKHAIILVLIAISIGALSIIEVNRLFFRPLNRLQNGTKAIEEGQFGYQIPVKSMDEIGELTGSFNHMSQRLAESKRLEEQLYHLQKMDAIGQLAGGIAHEFNNILTAVMGYGSLLRTKISPKGPLMVDLEQILTAAERAANLTRSLLAFSRKQRINLIPVNLNEIVRNVEKLLSKLIGENIEFKTILTGEDLTVMADSGQIEQVLINLCINARDAMPDGGRLTISTEMVELGDEFLKTHGYGEPGKYTLISVTDTGTGMDEKTRERIFEPFFTTKEVGKGTGLGLAVVYGIIKQHNGLIDIYSEIGKGTAFKIYLPVIKSDVKETRLPETATPRGGTETVLLAEDDAYVRKLVKDILERFGYKVIEAVNGEDAIDKFMGNKDRIQLLLLDVIMPKRNGKEVYEEIKKIRPDVKTIFTSGYPANIINKNGIVEEGLNFISKPVFPNELLKRVREVLDK